MASLNPRQIEAFRMVMLRGSITAAAQMLNVSQPAVSRLIRDLEMRSGLSLFERHGNHLVPTPEASQFLAEVERYALGLQALTTYAQELASRKRGSLRIIAMPAMAMGFLPQFVARFIDGRDLSRVYLHGTPSHLVIDAIASGQADVGFAAAPSERPGLVIEPLEAHVVVVLKRSHPLAKRRSLNVKNLKGHTLIALSEPTIFAGPIPEELLTLLQAATIVTPLTGIACHFVAAGAGLALVDPFSVVGLDHPDLVMRPLHPAMPVRISIVVGADRPRSNLATEFISALKMHVRQHVTAR